MVETYLSFYLRAGRIHVFVEALRAIGSPKRICFLVNETGNGFVMSPYRKRDFVSHAVPQGVYAGRRGLEINSQKLCQLVAELHHWDMNSSYRVPGTIIREEKIVLFQLKAAEKIERGSGGFRCFY